MTLVDLASIASIITVVIAVMGIYPLFRSLRQYERNLRFQVYRDVLAMLEHVREERCLLEAKTSVDPKFDVLKLDEESREPFYRLARAYDKLGVLIKHGVVPLEFVLDYYSKSLVSAWCLLSPVSKKNVGKKDDLDIGRSFNCWQWKLESTERKSTLKSKRLAYHQKI